MSGITVDRFKGLDRGSQETDDLQSAHNLILLARRDPCFLDLSALESVHDVDIFTQGSRSPIRGFVSPLFFLVDLKAI